MKRQRVVWCIGMGLAGCLLVMGCADKKVNYDVDEEEKTTQAQRGKTSLKQFTDAAAWTDEWTLTTSKGNTVKISIDADVIVPAVEQMSVVEVEETVFDEDYKEHMIKQIFGDEEVYYNDISHLTKKELTGLRTEYESLYEAYGARGLKWEQETYKYKIQECNAAMKKAKDTHTPAADFSVNEYWGNYAGIPYNLSFLEDNTRMDCGGRSVFLSPKDIYQVCPQNFREVENLTFEGFDVLEHGNLTENACVLSEEEAKKEAQSFVEHLGLEYSVYEDSEPLVWGDRVKKTEWTAAGYVFYFGFGKDNMSFAGFGTEETYWNFTMKRKETEKMGYSLNARVAVSVADTGVIGAVIQNPIETTGILEEVELLPLEEIRGIIEEQVTNHLGTFRFTFSRTGMVDFNEMELIYFRVKDKKNPGCYSYVPAWRLGDVSRDGKEKVDGIQNQVLINAMDGSVIDFFGGV